MAEKIVSPGVFTSEIDLSFLPQGIGEIGAVVIGPTKTGPAFLPTIIESYNDFETTFGTEYAESYVPYAVKSYLRSAGRVTIVRVLGLSGYNVAKVVELHSGGKLVALLAPSAKNASGDLGSSSIDPTTATASNAFRIAISGSNVAEENYSASIDISRDDFITNVFGQDPQSTQKGAYVYKVFKTHASASVAAADADMEVTVNTALDLDAGTNVHGNYIYGPAATPDIKSQNDDALFKFVTLTDGSDSNQLVKVGIRDVKPAGSIAGSDYGSFTVVVRKFSDTDQKPIVYETFQGCNLDSNSPSYVAKKIGDRFVDTIGSDGKIKYGGNYQNNSSYIRVVMESTANEKFAETAVPWAHSAYKATVKNNQTLPDIKYVTDQVYNDEYSAKEFYGIDVADDQTKQLLFGAITDDAGAHTSGAFSLNSQYGSLSTHAGYVTSSSQLTLSTSNVNQRKFVVGFQGGFDGLNPATQKKTGADIVAGNTLGFDCSAGTSGGTLAYKKALNAVSNPDEFDINLVVTPGIVHGVHSAVSNHAILLCETRGDCFYLMDSSKPGDALTVSTGAVSTLDTNYAATYYPWVKILDGQTSKPTWVPPSVVLSGVIAYTDKVSHEWFAPAGLNRGGLTEVVEAETRLTHEERDDLYEDRVNPIASFPNEGVCVWGQKTLQGKPSALDRVNVRRLLIRLKKFIASSSRYLVFEQNTSATRNRFLNIVNPYLESVQANSGLSAFKVVMDDSNNTPDLVDRNILYGQIFIQPTRTAEFIVLDFSVLPTGATFPE